MGMADVEPPPQHLLESSWDNQEGKVVVVLDLHVEPICTGSTRWCLILDMQPSVGRGIVVASLPRSL